MIVHHDDWCLYLLNIFSQKSFNSHEFLIMRIAAFYVTIPTPEIDRLKPLIRMLLYQLLQALTVQPRPAERPFLFLLNEFPLLGNMRVLSAMLPVVRGYGIKLVLARAGLEPNYPCLR